MRMSITSAAGVLSLLDEPEPEIKLFALKKLDEIVDCFWAEISEAVDKIEMLYEDATFKHRNLAALVASKVYYHLGAFEESLTFALGADELFDVNSTTEYVETTIAKCIDHYTKLRVTNAEGPADDQKSIDDRLEDVVNRMFQRCFDDRQFKQAVGIALETRRIDMFESSILKADDTAGMMSYAVNVCMSLIQNRYFRNTILRVLVKLYLGLATPDFINVCQCLIFLDDPQAVAEILEKLIKGEQDSVLMAYQIGFDLYESATQQFLQRVQAALRATAPVPIAITSAKMEQPPTEPSEDKPTDEKPTEEKDAEKKEGEKTESAMETGEATPEAPVAPKVEELSESDRQLQDRLLKLHGILGGTRPLGSTYSSSSALTNRTC